MTTTLLTGPGQKEGLSVAYVKALAARAGFSTAVPEPDRDSVDVRIMAGGPRRPALDLQLKATTDLADGQDGFRPFRLRIKELQRSSRRDADTALARGVGPAAGRGAVDDGYDGGARSAAPGLLGEPATRS